MKKQRVFSPQQIKQLNSHNPHRYNCCITPRSFFSFFWGGNFPLHLNIPSPIQSFLTSCNLDSIRLSFTSFSLPFSSSTHPSIFPFHLYGFDCNPLWYCTITLADKQWVLAALVAKRNTCRRYLKQDVWRYYNKTKAINQFHIGPRLVNLKRIAPSAAFFLL